MPIILATGASTESGHSYADVLGVSYEYPSNYRKLVTAGESFVYYRGRRRYGGGSQPQVYLGCGTIGSVESSVGGGLLTCAIDDYEAFAEPVSFKDADGRYLEPGGVRAGYFQPGVRRVSVETYQAIVARGLGSKPAPASGQPGGLYAEAEDARAIEQISRVAAIALISSRPENLRVAEMPTNNPGFDLIVETESGTSYIEVKGTRGRTPRFLLSEGERKFAEAHRDSYTLLVVVGIDLASRTWTDVLELREPPSESNSALRVQQWIGELVLPRLPLKPSQI